MRIRPVTTVAGAIATAIALVLTGTGPVAFGADGESPIAIADTDASAETKSLFSYLDDTRGEGVLFGHQHTTDNGITFGGAPDGVKSDVLAGTGEYPAVFGWDTLILEGRESPGLATNTPEQNVAAFRGALQQADRLGGISTISAHMRNFVTGNDFTDASGRVISHILPGGDKNADFNAYLDQIAELANTTTNDDGELIPLIFRPFHENTGSWFWWGAAWASPGEYKEIFRYTVEYLRDLKGVTNLLYAYSPNGSFGGDETRYLNTYPGDAWVDILGYDYYENSNVPEDSDAWIAQLIPDLGMIADLADERGKVAAFTEFGRNGDRTIQPTGNKSLEYYTDLLAAIKADPKASRIAYVLTWANFGGGQIYVPYPAYGDQPEHEMYQDFKAFYDDEYTVFSEGIAEDAFTRDVEASPNQPSVRLVTPADGQRVETPTTTVRAKVTAADADRVYFVAEGDPVEHELALGADGYYSGQWDIGEENLTNQTVALTVTADVAGDADLVSESTVVLGSAPTLPVGLVDDFEGYGDDAALRAAYAVNNGPADAVSLSTDVVGSGDNAVRFAYEFTGDGGYRGFGKSFPAQDWSGFNRMNAWLAPDGSDQKLVFQLKAGGYTFEAYPSLAGSEPTEISIPLVDFRPPSWDTANADKRVTAALARSVTEFSVFVNQVGAPSSGSIVLDDLRAVAGEGDPLPDGEPTDPTDPTPAGPVSVDDFESYADDTALRTTWGGRDNENDLSLSTEVVGAGSKAAAFAYDFSEVGYAGISRSIDQDWSANDRISTWVKPDGSNHQVVVQFKAGGVSYEGYATLAGTAPVDVSVPFADAVPSSYQGLDPALRPTAEQLKDVTEFVIFVTQQGTGIGTSGVVYFDDIRATTAGEEPAPAATSKTFLAIGRQVLLPGQRTTASVAVVSDGESVPTGAVTLRIGARTYTVDVDAQGKAKFPITGLRRGLYTVTASYAGDDGTSESKSTSKRILVLF